MARRWFTTEALCATEGRGGLAVVHHRASSWHSRSGSPCSDARELVTRLRESLEAVAEVSPEELVIVVVASIPPGPPWTEAHPWSAIDAALRSEIPAIE